MLSRWGRRVVLVLGMVLAAAGVLPVATSAIGVKAGSPGASRPVTPVLSDRHVGRRTARAVAGTVRPAGRTLVATVNGAIPRFARPGGPQTGVIPATWHSAPSALPVLASRAGWLEVRLAQRPNESTAWVRAGDVTLSSTPYTIVVDLATPHLTLYDGGREVFAAPAGVGAAGTPTPVGQFFVAFLAIPTGPGYGPFVLVTSAHSDSISDWEMSGDAMIAIHGPLGADAAIGTSGAHVSHGCIRLHERDLDRLSQIPAGTPVTILAR